MIVTVVIQGVYLKLKWRKIDASMEVEEVLSLISEESELDSDYEELVICFMVFSHLWFFWNFGYVRSSFMFKKMTSNIHILPSKMLSPYT